MKNEDPTSDIQRRIMSACADAQEELGQSNDTVVCVLNALMNATTTYMVKCTTGDHEVGRTRYRELSGEICKVAQEFFTKYSGGALIIDLDDPKGSPNT